MNSNGNNQQSQNPTSEELKQWARVPQQPQPLVTESEFTPDEATKPRPLSGHPAIKIALVSDMTLPIFVVAGLMMNANRPTAQVTIQPSISPSPNSTAENSDAKTIAAQREALGQTQANYALKEQQDRLKQQSSTNEKPPKNGAIARTPVKPVITTRQAAPVETPQPLSYTPPLVQRIQPTVAPPSPISKPASITPVPRESEQDNYDRYLALTQVGRQCFSGCLCSIQNALCRHYGRNALGQDTDRSVPNSGSDRRHTHHSLLWL